MAGELVNGFSVTAVLFGDHVDLAERCLRPLVSSLDPTLVKSVRVGLNAVGSPTRGYVRAALDAVANRFNGAIEPLLYNCGEHNRLKYPLLRKMLYDSQHPILTPFVMHFDDDTYQTSDDMRWWEDTYRFARREEADVMGSIYTMPARPKQLDAIRAQPWYNNRPLRPGHRFRFATGGWWVARTAVLRQFDWPFPEIKHNGGDTVLGELLRQQGLKLVQCRSGVRINADDRGCESKAPRRGVTMPPVWSDFDLSSGPSLDHHDFEVFAGDFRARDVAK